MNEKTETPETIAAIVAEMREYDNTPPPKRAWLGLADRIEAAAEREYAEAKDYFAKLHDGPSMICTAKNCAVRNIGLLIAASPRKFDEAAPGNSAALREAIVNVASFAANAIDHDGPERDVDAYRWLGRIAQTASAALAAPARNCDVGTAEEQRRRFDEFCEGRLCAECPFTDAGGDCPIEWANAPAQEGGDHA